MRRPGARRSFWVLAALLVAVATVADLMRPDSWIASAWARLGHGPTRMERAVDQVHESRPAPRG